MVNLLRTRLETEVTSARLEWLTAKTVYRHPTLEKLKNEIVRSLNTDSESICSPDHLRISNLATLSQEYTAMLQGQRLMRDFIAERSHHGLHIALTGSSGSLGSQILKALARDTSVAAIYCLDRPNPLRAGRLGQVSEESRGSLKVYRLTVDLLYPNSGSQRTCTFLWVTTSTSSFTQPTLSTSIFLCPPSISRYEPLFPYATGP